MTAKRKLVIAGVAVLILVWVVLGSLFGGGVYAAMRNFGEIGSTGKDCNTAVAVKDFEPLELVFVTATAKRGDGVDARDLLLKEAQKLGGHGIINVNINVQRKAFSRVVTLTGSALAIKYTESAGVPATGYSLGGLSQIRRGFGGWWNW